MSKFWAKTTRTGHVWDTHRPTTFSRPFMQKLVRSFYQSFNNNSWSSFIVCLTESAHDSVSSSQCRLTNCLHIIDWLSLAMFSIIVTVGDRRWSDAPPCLQCRSFRLLRRFKPKFHYADFHRNFPAGKVVDTSHLDMSTLSQSRRNGIWALPDYLLKSSDISFYCFKQQL